MNAERMSMRRALLKAVIGTAATLPVARVLAATAGLSARGVPVASTTILSGDAPDARAAAASAHYPFGPVIPALDFPSLPLTTQTGRTVDAREWLRGHVTALQLMFTGCSATCPIQGAIFAAAQRHLGSDLPSFRFVSLSIDPLADTPAALTSWLAGFEARSEWWAAAPRLADVEKLAALLRGVAGLRSGNQLRPTDAHTAQVYFLDRDAHLVLRSADFPSAVQVATNLRGIAALRPSKPA